MKAELITPQTTFKPVAIALTFETQDELDAFGSLFNYSPVCETLMKLTKGRIDDEAIRVTVTKAGGDVTRLHAAFVTAMREEIA
jgi:hypothetical protein